MRRPRKTLDALIQLRVPAEEKAAWEEAATHHYMVPVRIPWGRHGRTRRTGERVEKAVTNLSAWIRKACDYAAANPQVVKDWLEQQRRQRWEEHQREQTAASIARKAE